VQKALDAAKAVPTQEQWSRVAEAIRSVLQQNRAEVERGATRAASGTARRDVIAM